MILMFTTLLVLLYPPLKGFSHRSDSHIREESSLLLQAFKGHLKPRAFERVLSLNLPAKGIY